jgi:cytochrome c-type biogenesis protein CcmH/NrfF
MWRIWVLLALPVIIGGLIWRVRRMRRLRDEYEQEQQKQAGRLQQDEGDED